MKPRELTGGSPMPSFRFWLSDMLWTIAVVGILLAIGRSAPALDILIAPATVCTAVTAWRSRFRGQPITPTWLGYVFAVCFILTICVLLATGWLFFVLRSLWRG